MGTSRVVGTAAVVVGEGGRDAGAAGLDVLGGGGGAVVVETVVATVVEVASVTSSWWRTSAALSGAGRLPVTRLPTIDTLTEPSSTAATPAANHPAVKATVLRTVPSCSTGPQFALKPGLSLG